jgi:hypothetical protein
MSTTRLALPRLAAIDSAVASPWRVPIPRDQSPSVGSTLITVAPCCASSIAQ